MANHDKLDNGLTVLSAPDPESDTAAVGFFVKTGARDETAALMGVSHFLEHMMFKGTPTRTAEDVNRDFDRMGADYNAYTSHEATVYYAHVVPEKLPEAVDLLSDMLRPTLKSDDFDMEKKVILEEIGMYEDRPEWRLQDALLEAYFGTHGLGYRVLGTPDSLNPMTPEQMRGYFEARYAADNITVAVAGQFDEAKLKAQLVDRCGQWNTSRATRDNNAPAPQQKTITMTDEKLNRQYWAAMMPAPSLQHPKRYAAMVLADLIGDHDSSRFHWALIDPGLADEAGFSYDAMDGTGAFLGWATCDPDRAEKVQGVIRQALQDVQGSLKPDEVERSATKLATRVTLRDERPAGRMHALGSMWLARQEITPLQDTIDRLLAVTVDDLDELLDAMPLIPLVTAGLGPK